MDLCGASREDISVPCPATRPSPVGQPSLRGRLPPDLVDPQGEHVQVEDLRAKNLTILVLFLCPPQHFSSKLTPPFLPLTPKLWGIEKACNCGGEW